MNTMCALAFAFPFFFRRLLCLVADAFGHRLPHGIPCLALPLCMVVMQQGNVSILLLCLVLCSPGGTECGQVHCWC
ncbi:MAG: hypothetical protein J3Q66DRAFT_336046 [Benniella sp.]|nr:MAG: hypothetical protein J3Q66DRAFT_336046 [Benniella sp.]